MDEEHAPTTILEIAVDILGDGEKSGQKQVEDCLKPKFIHEFLQMYDGLVDMSGCSPAARDFVQRLQARPGLTSHIIQ